MVGVSGFEIPTAICVLQIQLAHHRKNNKVIVYEHCENTNPAFLIFVISLQIKEDHIWALCLRSSVRGELLQPLEGFNENYFQVFCVQKKLEE